MLISLLSKWATYRSYTYRAYKILHCVQDDKRTKCPCRFENKWATYRAYKILHCVQDDKMNKMTKRSE